MSAGLIRASGEGGSRMLKVGSGVWLPCEVRPGPFNDERVVRIRVDDVDWVGFVNTEWLRVGDILEGSNAVLAKVSEVSGGRFVAMIPGSSPNQPSTIEGQVDRWVPVGDPVET